MTMRAQSIGRVYRAAGLAAGLAATKPARSPTWLITLLAFVNPLISLAGFAAYAIY